MNIFYHAIVISFLAVLLPFCVYHYEIHKTLLPSTLDSNGGTVSRNFSGSSVWCTYTEDMKRLCSFSNLYFNPRENLFLFLLNKDSVLSGIGKKEDLRSFDVSSVANHNRFKMKLIPVSSYHGFTGKRVFSISFGIFLWRFKMDNIMHVLHDDLLPLYFTYSHLCHGDVEFCQSKYRMVFLDYAEKGPFYEWYKLFSDKNPVLRSDLMEYDLVTFTHCHVGLVTTSLWFQYGFGQPQGPIKPLMLHSNMLFQFAKYVVDKFNISFIEKPPSTKHCILLSRKINRRIVNENELINRMKLTFSTVFPEKVLRIYNLDLSTNSSKTIVTQLYEADYVVGMHGSAMILCLFLKPGATVVELFPLGINPDNVSPVKALSEIAGSHFHYVPWVNRQENNSFPNENTDPLLGGINHLSEAEQNYIRSVKEVPAVECCHNPLYLFRMFQDTLVGTDFINVFKQILIQHNDSIFETITATPSIGDHWYFPAPVRNITCFLKNGTIVIKWLKPINLKVNHIYDIALSNGAWHMSTTSNNLFVSIKMPTGVKTVHVWVKCISEGVESLDAYTECFSVDN